jgi:Tfp pilus assembly PilM family ATPase
MLPSEVFLSQIKVSKSKEDDIEKALMAKVKNKLPFSAEDATLKYIPGQEDNYLVIASEREKINRHLAIFEKANLNIKTIGIWPTAITNSYVNFFGRRKSDVNKIVLLLNLEKDFTNIVICSHSDILFAHSVSIGTRELEENEQISKLVLELNASRQYFDSITKNSEIDRLVFLCDSTVDENLCQAIAKKTEMPAQMGNCLAAVEINKEGRNIVDRRNNDLNWTTVFGLSLQG